MRIPRPALALSLLLALASAPRAEVSTSAYAVPSQVALIDTYQSQLYGPYAKGTPFVQVTHNLSTWVFPYDGSEVAKAWYQTLVRASQGGTRVQFTYDDLFKHSYNTCRSFTQNGQCITITAATHRAILSVRATGP